MKKYTTPEMKALSFVAEEAISVSGNLDGASNIFNDGEFGGGSWENGQIN